MKFSVVALAMFLFQLPVQGGSEITATNFKSPSRSSRRSLLTCSGGFTFNACAVCSGCKFTTRDDLTTAVTAYSQDKTTAVNTYGEMNCWDVSSITDMSGLFYPPHSMSQSDTGMSVVLLTCMACLAMLPISTSLLGIGMSVVLLT